MGKQKFIAMDLKNKFLKKVVFTFKDSGSSSTFKHLNNFGLKNETEVVIPGTNAKMNEMQASMGSLMPKYMGTLYEKLKDYNIFPRRYSHPLLNEFTCYQSIPVSKPLSMAMQISKRIITLPIYKDLQEDNKHQLCDVLVGIDKKIK